MRLLSVSHVATMAVNQWWKLPSFLPALGGSAALRRDRKLERGDCVRAARPEVDNRLDEPITSRGEIMPRSPGTAKKTTKKTTKRTAASKGFTPEERAAMKERAKEVKASANRAEGEKALLAAIAKMPEPDRALGKRLHEIVEDTAPDLAPKTWYGMPAYAKDDKVLCYFQSADKFKSRYATFGFNDTANLDQGDMWPTSFAVKEMTPDVEKKIARLVKKAVS
jgi:uncharacterized protein YdhG (YjbR/CyaY superfamily)